MSVIPISRIFIGKDMESRLVHASEIGDLSTVKKLLKFKVNPNARDESGMSALTKACDGIKHVVFMFEIKQNLSCSS